MCQQNDSKALDQMCPLTYAMWCRKAAQINTRTFHMKKNKYNFLDLPTVRLPYFIKSKQLTAKKCVPNTKIRKR
jgi:hypothetical protein